MFQLPIFPYLIIVQIWALMTRCQCTRGHHRQWSRDTWPELTNISPVLSPLRLATWQHFYVLLDLPCYDFLLAYKVHFMMKQTKQNYPLKIPCWMFALKYEISNISLYWVILLMQVKILKRSRYRYYYSTQWFTVCKVYLRYFDVL